MGKRLKFARRILAEKHFITAIYACAFLGFVILFYPGLMSPDSVSQYLQSLPGAPLSDWHPPILSIVWRALRAVTGSFGAMIVVQLFLYWGALCALSVWLGKKNPSDKFTKWLPFVFGCAPFSFILSGIIWKDVHMTIALIVACVVAMYISKSLSRVKLMSLVFIATSALLYAGLVRHSVWLATVPIALLVGYRIWRKLSIALLYCGLSLIHI